MASNREREVEQQFAAQSIDFRTLLLGAWPDGSEDGPEPTATAPVADPADDPQWITWSDARAEEAWEDIEVSLALGAGAAPRSRHAPR